jgi:oligopeptide/dipeptide ABC transporter ATP-binding protein
MTTPTITSHPLVRLDDVSVTFPVRGQLFSRKRQFVRAVNNVSLSVERGQTVGIVGESGSGKSTLGRVILRLIEPASGHVYFDDRDLWTVPRSELRALRRRMQMIFQDPYGSLDPRMSVEEIVTEPIDAVRSLKGEARYQRIVELLGLVGLDPSSMFRLPHEFSGGQRQRIGIARALAAGPELIVCDEPVSALDVSIQAQVLNLLEELRSRLRLTYVFIAHDLSVVRHVSSTVVVMYLGSIMEMADTETLFRASGHPYTRALLSAIPVPNPRIERKRRRVILKGEIPSPIDPPSGCVFHTRCWLYQRLGEPKNCRTERPPAKVLSPTQTVACHYVEESLKSDIGVV